MGKKSWWRKFTCGSSKKDEGEKEKEEVNRGDGVKCMACGAEQPQVMANVFVCVSCSKVNRINGDTVSVVSKNEDPIQLMRTSSSTFAPIGSEPAGGSALGMEPVVPVCTVCMDGPGDMVLLPCSHGGLCEGCAKHIAKNLSVGGNHCIKCRTRIEKLVRLDELYRDSATGLVVEVPKSDIQKGPPKVPAPPGLNKEKGQSREQTKGPKN